MKRYVIPLQTNQGQSVKIQIQTKNNSNHKRKVKTWTADEDQKLVRLHNQYPKNWNIIAELMANRNQNQCLHRFRRISQLGSYKKIWGEKQDQLVLKMVRQVGNNWKLISNMLGTKTGKQIRQRFINKLDPNIKREQWTESEDLKLIQLYSKYGSKWCQISKQLTGRPQNKIKNRFYSYIQKNYSFKIQGRQGIIGVAIDQNKQNSSSSIKVLQNKTIKTSRFGAQQGQIGWYPKDIANQTINYQDQQIFQGQQQSEMLIEDQNSNIAYFQHQYEVKMEEVKQHQSMKQINDINDIAFSRVQQNNFLYFQDDEN